MERYRCWKSQWAEFFSGLDRVHFYIFAKATTSVACIFSVVSSISIICPDHLQSRPDILIAESVNPFTP